MAARSAAALVPHRDDLRLATALVKGARLGLDLEDPGGVVRQLRVEVLRAPSIVRSQLVSS